MVRRRRSAPTYLTERDGRIFYHYRLVVEHRGVRVVRWVNCLSEHPYDWRASLEAVRMDRERRRRQIIAEIEQRIAGRERPTLSAIARDWLRDAEERGRRTDVVRYQVARLLEDLGVETLATELTADRILEWRRTLMTRPRPPAREGGEPRPPLSPVTVNAYIGLLSMILEHGIRHWGLRRNPARLVGRLDPGPSPHPQTLSHEQLRELFLALDEYEAEEAARLERIERSPLGAGRPALVPLRGIVLAIYYTLARTKDVLRLRWEHIDLERQIITFRETKNRRRVHDVVVPIRAPLMRWLLDRWPGPGASGWVFPNPATGEPFRDIRRQWRRLIRLANRRLEESGFHPIPEGFRLYNLRHTGASHLAATGSLSAQEIAQMMGDTSVRTVERHYFHTDARRLAADLHRASTDPALRSLDEIASQRRPTAEPRLEPKSTASGNASQQETSAN